MQMLITCKKSTIMGSSRNRIWHSDEKRQDLKVNNYNTHDERFLISCLFSDFVVCLLLQISFFQEPFSKMSSWQTASFTWQGKDNAQLLTCGSRKLAIPRSALSEQILRHFNAQLETQFPSNGWPLLQNEAKTMSGTRVENIVALSFVTNAEICFNWHRILTLRRSCSCKCLCLDKISQILRGQTHWKLKFILKQ